jgi:excisionase family DNA binding protein
MLRVEISLVMRGKDVDLDSMVEAIAREVCDSVQKKLNLPQRAAKTANPDPPQGLGLEAPPRQAVSIREAARLLSISTRTLHNYIAMNAIRTVRVGRRVLIPMKAISDVANNGMSSGRINRSTGQRA